MNNMTNQTMTCAEFQALLTDYLEAHALSTAQRSVADAHAAGCVECAALVADVRTIMRDAGELPSLTPARDLWSGIEGRIEAPVVEIGTSGERRAYRVRRLAIAASVLIAVTAGVTYTLTKGSSGSAVSPDSARLIGADRRSPLVHQASRPSAEETFDREIASIRKIADARSGELDTATTRVVATNLKLIDAAIAESKAALARDPASAFLLDQLTRAFDTKLQLLRGLATLPARS